MLRAGISYGLLGLLFACACVVDGGESWHLIDVLRHKAATPGYPLRLAIATRTIVSGAFAGDQLLAIDGTPVISADQVSDAIASAMPGQTLRLTLAKPGGRAIERFVVVPSLAAEMNTSEAVARLCANILIPTASIAVGFGVTASRLSDANAWIMLAMLLGFSEVFADRTGWGVLPGLTEAWAGFWISLWPGFIAWLGLRFPQRFQWERRRPWMKFALMTVAGAAGFFHLATILIWRRNINLAQMFRSVEIRTHLIWLAGAVLGFAVFFASTMGRARLGRTPDARRRSKILLAGAGVAFAPAFLLYTLGSGVDRFRAPWPVILLAFAMVAVFPLALGCAILVERAMDLRVMLRESLQYAVGNGAAFLILGMAAGCGFYAIQRSAGNHGNEWTAAIQSAALAVIFILISVLMGRRQAVAHALQWIDRRFFRADYEAALALREIAREAGGFTETAPLLESVAKRIGDALQVHDIVILLRENGKFHTAYTTRPGERLDIPPGSGIVAALAARRRPLRVWFENPPGWIRALGARDLQTLDFMRTELLLPIPGGGNPAGILSLGPRFSEAPYSDSDIRLLQSIVAQTGPAPGRSRGPMTGGSRDDAQG